MNILTNFKNLTIESLRDNKKLIIGLYVLFIVCFIAAWIVSGAKMATLHNTMGSNVSPTPLTGDGGAIDLFIHNEWGGIVTYVGSIFFGIPAIILLMYNGVNLGLMGQMFSTFFPNGGLKYIIYLIPHGIFEITATVLQSVAGILLFLFIWNFIKEMRSKETQGVSDAFEKTKKILIQSIILMIFSTILLLIAAPIEAYFSIPFSELLLGKV